MFRWGILSTAKIGREHFIPAVNQSDNGVLGGIASRDLKKAKERRVAVEDLAWGMMNSLEFLFKH